MRYARSTRTWFMRLWMAAMSASRLASNRWRSDSSGMGTAAVGA